MEEILKPSVGQQSAIDANVKEKWAARLDDYKMDFATNKTPAYFPLCPDEERVLEGMSSRHPNWRQGLSRMIGRMKIAMGLPKVKKSDPFSEAATTILRQSEKYDVGQCFRYF